MSYTPYEPLTFEELCVEDARLIIAQAEGWNYCGKPEPGEKGAAARRLARAIRKRKGWKPLSLPEGGDAE